MNEWMAVIGLIALNAALFSIKRHLKRRMRQGRGFAQ